MDIPKDYPWWKQPMVAASVYDVGGEPFRVYGGPLARPISMGGYIIDGNGFIIAVTNDIVGAKRIVMALRMIDIMRKMDIAFHVRERYDDGYIVCSDEEWGELSELMNALIE